MMNRLIGFCVLIIMLSSCGKGDAYIPEVPVNYTVTIQEFNIKAKNGVLIVADQGVAGLLIVNTVGGYRAYDRCSSVNPQQLCKITADDGGITATDPCTGAKFLLLDGSPQKAPAVRSLKSYRINLQGQQLLQVTN